MIGFVRLVSIVLAALFAFTFRRAGFTYLVPAGIALAVGWPLSRLAPPPRRCYVLALAVLSVHFLWITLASLFWHYGFDTPILGSLVGSLVEDGETFEAGVLGAWFFRLDGVPPVVGCFTEMVAIVLLGIWLLRSRSSWPAIAACIVLALLAVRLGLGIMHDGWRDAHPTLFAHFLLRLTGLVLLLMGMFETETARLLATSEETAREIAR